MNPAGRNNLGAGLSNCTAHRICGEDQEMINEEQLLLQNETHKTRPMGAGVGFARITRPGQRQVAKIIKIVEQEKEGARD